MQKNKKVDVPITRREAIVAMVIGSVTLGAFYIGVTYHPPVPYGNINFTNHGGSLDAPPLDSGYTDDGSQGAIQTTAVADAQDAHFVYGSSIFVKPSSGFVMDYGK